MKFINLTSLLGCEQRSEIEIEFSFGFDRVAVVRRRGKRHYFFGSLRDRHRSTPFPGWFTSNIASTLFIIMAVVLLCVTLALGMIWTRTQRGRWRRSGIHNFNHDSTGSRGAKICQEFRGWLGKVGNEVGGLRSFINNSDDLANKGGMGGRGQGQANFTVRDRSGVLLYVLYCTVL